MQRLQPLTVTHAPEYQGVTIWLGDDIEPVHIGDDARPEDVAGWIDSPIQRAVTIARLTTIADILRVTEEQENNA